MRKIWVVLLFVLMVGLAGCGQVEGHIERVWDSQEMQGMTPTMPPVTPTLPLNPAPVVSVTSNIYQAANDFAFRLTSTLLGASGDGNFVLSPFSVWLPLAALANVTCEELLPELLGALSLDCEVPTRQINRTVRQMLGRLTNEGFSEHMPSPLSIANAIYTRDDYTLNSDFARIFAHYFMGELDQVNFLNPATADIVNAWAYEHTDGRIPQVVSPDMFNELTAALIANAILFQGDWRWQFEPELTTRGNFYGAQGTTQAYLMERVFDDVGNTTVMFFEDDEVEALQLLFQQGGAMTILLPRNGDATGLLTNMNANRFEYIRTNSERATGRLVLPRFEIENEHDLLEALEALGVPLFNPANRPLDNILEEYGHPPIFISDIFQIANIEVDEQGATAAAVTVGIIEFQSLPPPPPATFDMVCNRPFAFVLHSWSADQTAQVLFTGVINQP